MISKNPMVVRYIRLKLFLTQGMVLVNQFVQFLFQDMSIDLGSGDVHMA